MFFGGNLLTMVVGVLAILMSITVHELAHGYMAYCLGDETAKNAGRLTLNPIKHLDPLGALLMFLTGFGWAKPVPINPFFFQGNRTVGLMLVSLAGPVANLLLAMILATLFPLLFSVHQVFYTVLPSIIYLNIYLEQAYLNDFSVSSKQWFFSSLVQL